MEEQKTAENLASALREVDAMLEEFRKSGAPKLKLDLSGYKLQGNSYIRRGDDDDRGPCHAPVGF